MNTIERAAERFLRIEYGTVVPNDQYGQKVVGVQCRDKPTGKFWNTVTVKVRSVKNEGNPDEIVHYYALVLQRYSQKWAGNPYTPRIGDMVAMLFIFNQKPLVLGTVVTDTQDPVCRSPFCSTCIDKNDARYDEVDKRCQFQMPEFNENNEVTSHKPGDNPNCKKWFHKNRDEISVYNCKEGCKSACQCCTMLDHIKRCSNQWEKHYSCETDSSDPEHPYIPCSNEKAKKRHEFHEYCGSYLVFQNNTDDKDHGKGLVRLENATCESCMKGHINMRPTGTIDVHSTHDANTVPAESKESRMMVVPTDDSDFDWAYEAIYFEKNSYIRIMKDGKIEIHSLNNNSYITIDGNANDIKIDGTSTVTVHASSEITLDTPLVHMTGDCLIDGYCTHTDCTCHNS